MKRFVPHGKRKLANDKGQSMVEMALVLPIVVLILLGVIQFGIVFFCHVNVTAAAREGARMASVGKTDAEIITKIHYTLDTVTFLSRDSDPERSVTITPSEDLRIPGDQIEVYVPALVDVVVPLLGGQESIFPIAARASMRYQAE